MALYFYRNLLTNALVYSDQPAPPAGDRNMELIGEQTNMSPSGSSGWVFNDIRSSFVSVDKDDRVSGKITGLTSMGYMFINCASLTSIDMSGFDTSQVTNMKDMFNGCSSLASLDLSGFDTSQVTNMIDMFQNCSSLASLDLSGFDTSQATYMYNMFFNCSGLMNLDLSGFDTSKVTSMRLMFGNCRSLTSLDLSGFDTSNVTAMTSMFQNCSSLRLITVGGSMPNVLSELPADQYYPASGGSPVAKANLTAGTWVRDEADLSLVATLVETAQTAMALRRKLTSLAKRVAKLESGA